MKNSFLSFQKSIQERSHILSLLNKMDQSTFSLEAPESRLSFFIKNGEVFLQQNEEEQQGIIIQGESSLIKDLLEGKEKLRMLLGEKQLTVSAPFRMILLMESLFFLANARECKLNKK